MSAAMPELPSPPALRRCPATVAIVLAIGAVLGSVPNWSILFFFWLMAGLPALLLQSVIALFMLFRELDRGRGPAVVRRGWRVATSLAAIPLLVMVGDLSDFVEIARLGPLLRADAQQRGGQGGPHLAIVQTGDFFMASWGYLYDDTGEVTKPCGMQSAAWLAAATGRVGDSCDMSVRHVIGPFYRWGER